MRQCDASFREKRIAEPSLATSLKRCYGRLAQSVSEGEALGVSTGVEPTQLEITVVAAKECVCFCVGDLTMCRRRMEGSSTQSSAVVCRNLAAGTGFQAVETVEASV